MEEKAARKQQRYANAVENLTVCTGPVQPHRLAAGQFLPRRFLFFSPPTYLILSEKPFHEVSAKTAPNQPGSRWLAGWEVLSGKQSCKNQKAIYFHIYKASLQREAHGYLVSSAGAEL